VLLQKALTLQLPATGIAALEVSPADIDGFDAQKCYYSLEIPVGDFDFPVFVDQNAGARGDMNIVNSVLPSFIPSMPVTIPTGQAFPNNHPNGTSDSNIIYYTSVISTDTDTLTLQAQYSDYYGNIAIEGSTNVDSDWYPIFADTYEEVTETKGYVVKGFHPYVRMQFESNAGIVTNIFVR
jgi:hypothetical protein